jgi:hypothetical protein
VGDYIMHPPPPITSPHTLTLRTPHPQIGWDALVESQHVWAVGAAHNGNEQIQVMQESKEVRPECAET